MKSRIALVSCSIRAKGVVEDVLCGKNAKNERELGEMTERTLRAKKISNVERGLLSVSYGIKEAAEMDYLSLNHYFLPDGKVAGMGELIEKILSYDGIIFSTPVYFGQCSSLLAEFFDILDKRQISLKDKVIGFVSVGAKRNGGQETTIVWSAWEAMGLGACVVNDGAPASQFGGTCVAGSIGASAQFDDFGIETCIGLGKRVAETCLILKEGEMKPEARISVWLMGKEPVHVENARIVDITNYKLHRCKGCEVCPARPNEPEYRCINTKDEMCLLHPKLVASKAVYPIGWDMRFIERTRYLRRDNYRLTYQVAYMPDPKYIPVFIKENSILCRKHLVHYATLVSTGVEKLSLSRQIYLPIGY